jgi:hypothetical protein
LPYAVDAPFDSYHRQHELTCLENTRVDVLRQIFDWVDGQDERCIFWLNGLAGTGKSTIARTVACEYSEQKRLGASFFFSRGGGDVSHAGKFFTIIAVQLANNAPPLQRYICEAIRERSDITSKSLRDQWRQLVLGPLSKLSHDSRPSSYVLVVDALDECDDDDNIRIILQLLAEARSLKTVRLRIFMTSRREVPIRHGFYKIREAKHDFVLHNIPPAIVDQDISIFLEYNLAIIEQECYLAAGWPGKQDIRRLVKNANGLFIWAATACRFIREGRKFAADRLSIILNDDSSTDDFSKNGSSTDDSSMDDSTLAPEEQLNKIYIAVLKNAVSKYKRPERKKFNKLLMETAGAIILLFSPLSAFSLANLLHVHGDDITQTLDDLHSILDIPEDWARLIRLHHPSFRDFLLSKERCGDPKFWVDEKQVHRTLASNCIQLMSEKLRRDICGLRSPGALAAEVQQETIQQRLPAELQYACLYWVQHVQKSETRLQDDVEVHVFLQKHLLHWLEALNLLRKISDGILALISLDSINAVSQV